MKCRECSCCHKGYWESSPDVYVCTGVPEPFEVSDVDHKCYAYPEKRDKNIGCEYCHGNESFNITCFSWKLPNYLRLNLNVVPVPLNFCPYCGRELKDNNTE